MAVAMIGPKFSAWDKNGKPLAFGKLYTYQARTNTPKDTYQSEDQQVANTNPAILNGEGYANIYLDGSYKVVLKDSDDNEIWSADPVSASQPSEWVDCLPATYLSANSFKVNGNFTAKYEPGRRVRLDQGGADYDYGSISSSSYAGNETTIVLEGAIVTTGIDQVCRSLVGPESMASSGSIESLTLNEAKNSTSLKNGDLVIISDRKDTFFDVILISQTADDPNGDNLVQMVNQTELMLSQRNFSGIKNSKRGILGRTLDGFDAITIEDEVWYLDGIKGAITDIPYPFKGLIGVNNINNCKLHKNIDVEDKQAVALDMTASVLNNPTSTVVITGDSLSFNYYGFDSSQPSGNVAANTSAGLMSWSYLLRDMFKRSCSGFVHADSLGITTTESFSVYGLNTSLGNTWRRPFNGQFQGFSGQASGYARVMYKPRSRGNSLFIHYSNQGGDGGLFDVYYSRDRGQTFNLLGEIDNNTSSQNLGYRLQTAEFVVDNDPNLFPFMIEFRNAREKNGDPATSDKRFTLLGISDTNVNVILSGQGSQTTGEIEADFTNKIGQYNPDVVVLITGANDRGRSGVTVGDTATDLQSIIDQTKDVNQNADILVMNPPASDDVETLDTTLSSVGIETMRSQSHAMRDICIDNNAKYFDTFRWTLTKDAANYRFDNVHFSREGNLYLFNAIRAQFFNGCKYNAEYYTVGNYMDATFNTFIPRIDEDINLQGSVRIKYNQSGNSWGFSAGESVWADKHLVFNGATLGGVSEDEPSTPRLNFNYKLFSNNGDFRFKTPAGSVTMQPVGSNNGLEVIKQRDRAEQYVEFVIRKSDGSTPTSAELDGLDFVVSW